MRFLRNPNVNFMNSRRIAFVISATLILISIVSLIIHGGPKLGVDFRSGTFLQIRFEDKTDAQKPIIVPIEEVRSIFSEFGLGDAEIKHYGSPREIAARVDLTEATNTFEDRLLPRLREKFSNYNVIEMRKETVSPKVGKELVWEAIWAILVAMFLILIYIMWRFELRYGVGAVLALFHDVIITLGIFSVLNLEISIAIVAALLTIIGYSLNDTIVVYDRIRENLKTFRRQIHDYTKIVNQSINETLSRTIVTSGTTLIVVVVLYFFGGEVIKDFAFALICGVIVGTYSSIYVASPVLVEWQIRKEAKPLVKIK